MQNLSLDDANFHQRRWGQKWNIGQGSSLPVTAGTGINGLTSFGHNLFVLNSSAGDMLLVQNFCQTSKFISIFFCHKKY